MGQLKFDVPDAAQSFVADSLWKDAYVCGIEGVPWQSRCKLQEERLTISRNIDSSGKLFIACPVPEIGMRTLATCSLRVSEDSYNLLLELARGSCCRARIQSDGWQRAGLALPDEFGDALADGTKLFLDAIESFGNSKESTRQAIAAISKLEQATDILGDAFIQQSIAFRKQREPQIGTLLAGTLLPPSPVEGEPADQFRETFNTAVVRLNWSEIESDAGRYDYENATASIQWCASNGIRVIGGPMFDFRTRLMPHFLYLMEDDFDALLMSVKQYVDQTVKRFKGSVHLWNCAAGLNTPGPINLTDEQTVRLAIGILESVRRCDPNTPAIMTFDQPYGEYLAKNEDAISPLHFADAICRTGLGLAGIGLDVRIGHQDSCTLPRSAVDFSNMIDRWATLGLPLMVQLGVPAGKGSDSKALAPSESIYDDATGDLGNENQLRVAGPLVRTLLAKHVVHGIVWNGWSDADSHIDSHCGVLDTSGRPRPMLDYLARLRKEFLV